MAAEVARKIFGVPHVVARLYNPQRERTYQQLDMDYVCGTTLVAESLLEKIEAGHGHHVQTLGDVEVLEFRAGPGVAGKRVKDVEIEHQFRMAVLSRGNVTFIPLPDTMLQPGDIIVGAVKEEAMARVEKYMEG